MTDKLRYSINVCMLPIFIKVWWLNSPDLRWKARIIVLLEKIKLKIFKLCYRSARGKDLRITRERLASRKTRCIYMHRLFYGEQAYGHEEWYRETYDCNVKETHFRVYALWHFSRKCLILPSAKPNARVDFWTIEFSFLIIGQRF